MVGANQYISKCELHSRSIFFVIKINYLYEGKDGKNRYCNEVVSVSMLTTRVVPRNLFVPTGNPVGTFLWNKGGEKLERKIRLSCEVNLQQKKIKAKQQLYKFY